MIGPYLVRSQLKTLTEAFADADGARNSFLRANFRNRTAPLQSEAFSQQAAPLRIAVAFGIYSVSANQGNSIVPLNLPPDSVSVSSRKV
jgi:hypothetical protein